MRRQKGVKSLVAINHALECFAKMLQLTRLRWAVLPGIIHIRDSQWRSGQRVDARPQCSARLALNGRAWPCAAVVCTRGTMAA